MDIAATLAPPPKTDPASAPASATSQESEASSFEDEFESTSAGSPDEAEETSAPSQETDAVADSSAPGNEMLIEVEDQTVPADVMADPEIEDAHNDEVVVAEAPEAAIAEPAIAEALIGEGADVSAETPAIEEESEETDAEIMPSEAAIDDADAIETLDADEPAIVPVMAANSNQAASEIPEQAAEETAAAAPDEVEPFMDIREAREKPYMSQGSDRLKTLHSFVPPQLADDASMSAMPMSEHQFTASSIAKASVGIAHVDGAVVADQVVAAIRADRGAGSVDVRLDPPELGRVRLHFNMERSDIVIATVSSERGETLDLLRRHSADLVRELERAGFTNVQLDFAAGNDSAFENWDQPDQNGYDALPEAMDDEQVVAYVRKAQGRLDRFV